MLKLIVFDVIFINFCRCIYFSSLGQAAKSQNMKEMKNILSRKSRGDKGPAEDGYGFAEYIHRTDEKTPNGVGRNFFFNL
jgi:hypothetical protein